MSASECLTVLDNVFMCINRENEIDLSTRCDHFTCLGNQCVCVVSLLKQ